MQECINAILAALPTVGSRKLYSEVFELVPAEHRTRMRRALLHLKAEGKVVSENTFENNLVKHELVRKAL